MANETPSRPPPFMANAILNFHFDYLHTSLSKSTKTISFCVKSLFENWFDCGDQDREQLLIQHPKSSKLRSRINTALTLCFQYSWQRLLLCPLQNVKQKCLLKANSTSEMSRDYVTNAQLLPSAGRPRPWHWRNILNIPRHLNIPGNDTKEYVSKILLLKFSKELCYFLSGWSGRDK